MNLLRLNPFDQVTCDESDDPSPHKASEVSEPHSRVELRFARASEDPRHRPNSFTPCEAGIGLTEPSHLYPARSCQRPKHAPTAV